MDTWNVDTGNYNDMYGYMPLHACTCACTCTCMGMSNTILCVHGRVLCTCFVNYTICIGRMHRPQVEPNSVYELGRVVAKAFGVRCRGLIYYGL